MTWLQETQDKIRAVRKEHEEAKTEHVLAQDRLKIADKRLAEAEHELRRIESLYTTSWLYNEDVPGTLYMRHKR